MRRRQFIAILGCAATVWPLKAAKALGIKLPQSILVQADLVIE